MHLFAPCFCRFQGIGGTRKAGHLDRLPLDYNRAGNKEARVCQKTRKARNEEYQTALEGPASTHIKPLRNWFGPIRKVWGFPTRIKRRSCKGSHTFMRLQMRQHLTILLQGHLNAMSVADQFPMNASGFHPAGGARIQAIFARIIVPRGITTAALSTLNSLPELGQTIHSNNFNLHNGASSKNWPHSF